jgi:peptidoglycan/xylan/chitin deacetylase (PgdA/CDA1 family)
MTSTESHQDIMTAIERRWTIHALRRFRERYNLDDDDPASLIDLVDRIELKYRAAFASPYWNPYPRVMIIAKLTRRNLSASPKVRIVYQRREQMIVTVLPLRLDPNRPNKLKTLRV